MTLNTHNHERHHAHRSPSTKLSGRSLSIATAIITGLVYTICILFVALTPQTAMAFFRYILHADLTSLARTVTWGNFIGGLIFWSVGTALYAALVARLYNSLTPR